jgi:hypothetical protein
MIFGQRLCFFYWGNERAVAYCSQWPFIQSSELILAKQLAFIDNHRAWDNDIHELRTYMTTLIEKSQIGIL